jgi:hypothetical protein
VELYSTSPNRLPLWRAAAQEEVYSFINYFHRSNLLHVRTEIQENSIINNEEVFVLNLGTNVGYPD